MKKINLYKDIISFLNNSHIKTPCLVVDLELVKESFKLLSSAFSGSDIFYAVKANSAPEVLRTLNNLDSKFDVSSIKEIEMCLAQGISPKNMSFGNTIKKSEDIAWAYEKGVKLFVFDSIEELKKIAKFAPRSKVYCRLQVDNKGAHWPLSNKFGCSFDMVKELLLEAKHMGLLAVGISFHVGSQQTNLDRWEEALALCKKINLFLEKNKINIEFINIGGGIPVNYLGEKINLKKFNIKLNDSFKKYFDQKKIKMMLEPGRALVANAGIIESEIIFVSKKSKNSKERWVYIDVGRFGGLAETDGESIKYDIKPIIGSNKLGPVVIAGPTCDGVDVLYEKIKYQFPLNIKSGDRIRIFSAGAYTSVYSSAFNGFSPLNEYFINFK